MEIKIEPVEQANQFLKCIYVFIILMFVIFVSCLNRTICRNSVSTVTLEWYKQEVSFLKLSWHLKILPKSQWFWGPSQCDCRSATFPAHRIDLQAPCFYNNIYTHMFKEHFILHINWDLNICLNSVIFKKKRFIRLNNF